MFGYERLEALLQSACDGTAGACTTALQQGLDSFRAGREPGDDVTTLTVRRT